MKKKHICIAAFLLATTCFTGCKAGQKDSAKGDPVVESTIDDSDEVKTDSLVYSQNGKGYSCNIKIDFPQGNGKLDEGIKEFLNSVLSDFAVCDNPDKPKAEYVGDKNDGKAMLSFYGKQRSKDMEEGYKSVLEFNESSEPPASYSFDGSVRLMEKAGKYVTYRIESYVYLGGAHGSSFSQEVNIVRATGKALETTVDTTKTSEMQPILRKGVIEYFKECGEEVSDDKLNDMLFINDNTIPLPATTPSLSENGLKFIYQQYEIGPYALGMVSFTVPFDKVKPFMTEEALKLIE